MHVGNPVDQRPCLSGSRTVTAPEQLHCWRRLLCLCERRSDGLPLPHIRHREPGTRQNQSEFIVGNVFGDEDIAERLDAYNSRRATQWAQTPRAASAPPPKAGERLSATVITSGGRIGDLDSEVCPITSVPLRLEVRRPA